MVDPDNEERLLKVPPHVVKRIKAEAYAEAVEAIKVAAVRKDTSHDMRAVAVAAIEALGGERCE